MSPGSPWNSLASTVVLEFLKMASMPMSLPHFLLRTGHIHQRFRSLTRCFVTRLVLKTLAFIHGPHWNSSGRFLSLQDPFHDRHAETERTAFCYIITEALIFSIFLHVICKIHYRISWSEKSHFSPCTYDISIYFDSATGLSVSSWARCCKRSEAIQNWDILRPC